MKFKNLRSGNIVSSRSEATIDLMKKSANYVPVGDAPAGAVSQTTTGKKTAKKAVATAPEE